MSRSEQALWGGRKRSRVMVVHPSSGLSSENECFDCVAVCDEA